jgi:hypothetical protein
MVGALEGTSVIAADAEFTDSRSDCLPRIPQVAVYSFI